MSKIARKFANEHVLNFTAQRYQLTRPNKVGPVMEMIRACQPKSYVEWEEYYFTHAFTKTNPPIKVDADLLEELGRRLYEKIIGTVQPEWTKAFESITLDECIEYVRQVTLQRTFDGYSSEISVVYGTLAKMFPEVIFEESPAKLDHSGDIDYLGWVGGKAFGLQIKPVTASFAFAGYSVSERMKRQFQSFSYEYGGSVFILYSVKKEIKNRDILPEIAAEIARLQTFQEEGAEAGERAP